MDLGLRDRVALVAASSRGLGRAVAEELARAGARVAMCSRDADALEAARAAIADATGATVVARPADLSEAADVSALVDHVREACGPVDVLVTNTGGPPSGTFEAFDDGAWQAAVEQNLFSVLRLVRAVLPEMKERRFGRIVNVTSIAVKQPVAGLMLSNSVRAAVTGFARTLANEVASYGITVNNVLPGFTRTERVEQLAARLAAERAVEAEDVVAEWNAEIPMGRLGRPEEFAAAVAFLASARASYITGASLPVDGGWIRSLH